MSIIKFANGKNSGTYALKQGIDYILNPDKTNNIWIAGNGINLSSPYEDMHTIQTLYRKSTGRSYIHYIISFDKDVYASVAFETACDCASYFADDYQYILALHTNTDNIHAHIILNTVDVRTGKKFSQSRKELLEFREYINSCLTHCGLNPIGKATTPDLYYSYTCDDTLEDIDNFWEPDLLIEDDSASSFFGPVDPDESENILLAEEGMDRLNRVIQYFHGELSVLPDGISYSEAETLFLQWKNAVTFPDEEAYYEHF